MTIANADALIAELNALLGSGDSGALRAAFRALGRASVFRHFASAGSLMEGAEPSSKGLGARQGGP